MKHRNASKVVNCIDQWNRVRHFFISYIVNSILTYLLSEKKQHFFEVRKLRIILMKGQVKVSGQNEYLSDTPTSSQSSSGDQKEYPPPPLPSSPGIGQELIGKNDDVYRLFVVSLS